MTRTNTFDSGLDKDEANFVQLSPVSFIRALGPRVSGPRRDHLRVARRQTWRETYARCRRLASCLAQRGISVGGVR